MYICSAYLELFCIIMYMYMLTLYVFLNAAQPEGYRIGWGWVETVLEPTAEASV